MLRWADSCQIDLTEYTHLNSYKTELKNRESIQRSLEEEGLM